MARTTKKQIEGMFERLVDAVGGTISTGHGVDGYFLEYAACYGGWQIIYLKDSMHCLPFGETRRPASEMYYAMKMAMYAAYIANGSLEFKDHF